MYFLAFGSLGGALPSAAFNVLNSATGGGAAVFPDALQATKMGEPVVIDSPGEFYSRVGGKVRQRFAAAQGCGVDGARPGVGLMVDALSFAVGCFAYIRRGLAATC